MHDEEQNIRSEETHGNGRREKNLGDCVLFATLEPCAPDSRNPPKTGCLRRITNARIKKCSGLINPDTNLGGNIAANKEVLHGKATSYIFNRVQA